MKEQIYYLNYVLVNKLFKPIREKKDIIVVLLESIRLMINGNTSPPKNSNGKLVLYVGKASRLIFFSEKKFFSINFPFFIDNFNDCLIYDISYDKKRLVIDGEIVSQMMEIILEKNIFDSQSISSFYEALDNICVQKQVWECLFKLLTFEDGYIRFDNDTKNVTANHPQYHIDLFYDEHNKIKFGFHNNINNNIFSKLVVNDDFYFLNKLIDKSK